MYCINPQTSTVWYKLADMALYDTVYTYRQARCWYMHADRALYGIHLQTSTVRYTLADIALYDMVYTYRQA